MFNIFFSFLKGVFFTHYNIDICVTTGVCIQPLTASIVS